MTCERCKKLEEALREFVDSIELANTHPNHSALCALNVALEATPPRSPRQDLESGKWTLAYALTAERRSVFALFHSRLLGPESPPQWRRREKLARDSWNGATVVSTHASTTPA